MARTIQQKIDKITEKLSQLITQHGTKNVVLIQREAAQLSGDENKSKQLYRIYQKIRRYENKLNDLALQLREQEENQSDAENNNTPINVCANCARRQSQYLMDNSPEESIYHLEFVFRPGNIIVCLRKFKNVSAGKIESSPNIISL